MMYIHFCNNCSTIRMLSGHKQSCPACGASLHELGISFARYSSLSAEHRAHLLEEARRKYS